MKNRFQEDINLMCRARDLLDTHRISADNQEYQYILSRIKSYIHTHCEHEYIMDLVDIHPERSETIHYCKYCYCTK
jgi:hypothetical protein